MKLNPVRSQSKDISNKIAQIKDQSRDDGGQLRRAPEQSERERSPSNSRGFSGCSLSQTLLHGLKREASDHEVLTSSPDLHRVLHRRLQGPEVGDVQLVPSIYTVVSCSFPKR